ncbi:MAG: DUF502 domain-containing protein [Halobacteriales archaeon]
MASWKRDAASGLVVVVPILLSGYVIYWLYRRVADLPVFQEMYEPLRVVVVLTIAVATVFGVGYLMRTKLGDVIEGWIDDLANRVPLVRVVYNASKMAVETAVTGTEELQTPVKIEPWDGMRMTAFKTGKTSPEGRDLLFLPTAPNITTGFVIEVDPDDYVESDERVEEALTRVLSAGFGESQEAPAPPVAVADADDERDEGDELPADD